MKGENLDTKSSDPTKRTRGRPRKNSNENLKTPSQETKTSTNSEEDVMVAALEWQADPYASLRAIAEESGIDPKVIQRIVDRKRSEIQPILSEMKTVQTSELTRMLEDRAYRALSYIDDYTLAQSSAKDLAIISGIMLEKRQLLKGEPTHIISTTERADMNELARMLGKELTRRNIDIFNEAEVIEFSESPRPKENSTHLQTVLKKQKLAAMEESGEIDG